MNTLIQKSIVSQTINSNDSVSFLRAEAIHELPLHSLLENLEYYNLRSITTGHESFTITEGFMFLLLKDPVTLSWSFRMFFNLTEAKGVHSP
jgi:hypothetical protein